MQVLQCSSLVHMALINIIGACSTTRRFAEVGRREGWRDAGLGRWVGGVERVLTGKAGKWIDAWIDVT